MQIAIDENNIRITASDATKEKNYKCPVCREDVVLRQGSINKWHFAHKASDCVDSWHYDMSDWHLSMQERFPEEQREVVVSYDGQIHRADILKDDMVIEFQHSPITMDELQERNMFYNKAGYKVAWVFDFAEQYDMGAIIDCPRNDDVLMYKWSNPKRYLNCLPTPKKNNKNIVIYFYWIDVDEEECINKVIWSTRNDADKPDFKMFIVDNYYIELEDKLNVENFFATPQDRLNMYIASFHNYFVTRKSGVKGYPRDVYICPRTNRFGIKALGEQGCLYCRYCAAVKEYADGFDSYCFYPNAIRETDGGHEGYECCEAPRF